MSISKSPLVLSLTIILGFVVSCKSPTTENYTIKKGDFQQTIIETGELAAVNVKSFIMPRFGRNWYQMKLTKLIDHGTKVEAGDTIMQFDPVEIQKFIIDYETQLETQQAGLEKTIVQIANKKSDLNSSLRSEQAAYDLKKLQMGLYEFEPDKTKKIKEFEFKQAQIRLDKIKQSIEFYEIISEKNLAIQELRVMRTKEQIKNAYDVLPELTIRTPISGIFQVGTNRYNGETLKIGDEVYYSSNLGNVPNMTWMKVKTIVNESDILKIKVGQKVNVRLDALHDVVFPGEINYISKLCRPIQWESRQKVFDVEIKILVSDERLKPGMTVGCEYICSDLEDVWYAPLSCVEKVEGKYYIYLKKGNGYVKQKVDAGPANNVNIVLKGEFEKGQELVSIDQLVTPKSEE